MVRSSPPPQPTVSRSRPLVGGRALHAEYGSWRLHRALRGRDFEDRESLQRFLNAQCGSSPSPLPADATPVDRAQDLFYLSRQAGSDVLARRLRTQALELDPENVDSLVDHAVLDAEFKRRLVLLEEAVALGEAYPSEAHLGAGDPEAGDSRSEAEERGWGVLSTRPGLRARAALALQLVELGRLEDAIECCARLLELDPSDNQGARYLSVSLLLEVGRPDEAGRILDAHAKEVSAIFSWASLLLEWETGGDVEAALEAARAQNRAVEETLLAPEIVDVPPPDYHEAGSFAEAEIVSDLLWRAWHKRPAAIEWLRERVGEDELGADMEEPVWERILEADEEELRAGLLPFLLPVEPATVARLRQLLEEGPDDEMPHVAEWAALLLRRLGAASAAASELVGYVCRNPCEDAWGPSEALETLASLGAFVVPQLLAAHAEEADPHVRYDLAEVLAATGVQNDEIFAVLQGQLEAEPALGAALFSDYGDAGALPLLFEYLDRADPELENTETGVADLVETIEKLGGSISAGQRERFAEYFKMRAYWETADGQSELESLLLHIATEEEGNAGPRLPVSKRAREPLLDLSRPEARFGPGHTPGSPAATIFSRSDRPGRNEPCWCGSGKKYKRCHLSEDEAQDS